MVLRPALLLLGLLIGACAPSSYPRLATVAKPGGVRLVVATSVGYAGATARVRTPADVAANGPGERVRANAAIVNVSGHPALGTLAMFWSELQLAWGAFEPCELGGSVSLLRAGLEARCALVRPEHGGIGVALGVAAMHHSLFGTDTGALNFAWRTTLEVSGGADAYTPLLNVALSYGPTQRKLGDVQVTDRERHPGDGFNFGSYGLFIVRDEFKLAVPVGFHIPLLQSGSGVIIGAVPEWTLYTANAQVKCSQCLDTLGSFDQAFAFYVTLGLSGLSE